MEKHIAKVLIIDEAGEYLTLWRSDHPTFPNDPDLPGGTVEVGETPAEGGVREVMEEAGIDINAEDTELLYQGSKYSEHGTVYYLYLAHIGERQEVKISWEHDSFEWLNRDDLVSVAKSANDTYMHMVSEVLSSN